MDEDREKHTRLETKKRRLDGGKQREVLEGNWMGSKTRNQTRCTRRRVKRAADLEEANREADAQKPKKNVQRGLIFLAVPVLQSDDHTETCDMLLEKHSTRLFQCGQHLSMSQMRQHDADTSNTQSVTTSRHFHVQSRSRSQCVCSRLLTQSACGSRS